MGAQTPWGRCMAAGVSMRAAGRPSANARDPVAKAGGALPWLCLATAILLAGCGSNMRAALQTAQQAWDGGQASLQPAGALQPGLDYLRVHIGRQSGLMVRADDEPGVPGPVGRWFSADGAVLRLLEGRLVGLTDGSRSWQLSRPLEPVDWRAVAQGLERQQTWVIDQQPGYRFGQRSERSLRLALAGPATHAMVAAGPGLRWFREADSRDARFSTWYAVDLASQPARVVYAQTCLEVDWCLSWQPWPAQGRR